MKQFNSLNNTKFLVGNIAPDCGVPNEDWSRFTPDKAVTHWWSKDGTFIELEDFKNKYLNEEGANLPFYLGYYFHLITDIAWSALYDQKKIEPIYAEGIQNDKNFIWTAKKDWYGQDHLFLQRNPDFVFFRMFAKIDAFENAYFDFYPANAFTRQIQYITNFYLSANEDPERPFPYLSETEMNDFVQTTIEAIERLNLIA